MLSRMDLLREALDSHQSHHRLTHKVSGVAELSGARDGHERADVIPISGQTR